MSIPHHSESLGDDQANRFCAGQSDWLKRPSMETNEDRRRRKLGELCLRHGRDDVAEAAGLSVEYLDQIIKGVKLPPKKDGTRSQRELGDSAARRIESAFSLAVGWLDSDWPFPLVNQQRWEALPPEHRGYIQHAINRALDEVEAAQMPILGNGTTG